MSFPVDLNITGIGFQSSAAEMHAEESDVVGVFSEEGFVGDCPFDDLCQVTEDSGEQGVSSLLMAFEAYGNPYVFILIYQDFVNVCFDTTTSHYIVKCNLHITDTQHKHNRITTAISNHPYRKSFSILACHHPINDFMDRAIATDGHQGRILVEIQVEGNKEGIEGFLRRQHLVWDLLCGEASLDLNGDVCPGAGVRVVNHGYRFVVDDPPYLDRFSL